MNLAGQDAEARASSADGVAAGTAEDAVAACASNRGDDAVSTADEAIAMRSAGTRSIDGSKADGAIAARTQRTDRVTASAAEEVSVANAVSPDGFAVSAADTVTAARQASAASVAASVIEGGTTAMGDASVGCDTSVDRRSNPTMADGIPVRRFTFSDGVELELLDTGVTDGIDPGDADCARSRPAETSTVGVDVSQLHEAHTLPLFLVHGFTGAAATWTELLPVLGEHRRVLALSLPGHGGSDAPSEPQRYAAARAAADVIHVLDALGIARVALLGYSMGGRVALHTALAAPERVSALVLESASPGIADDAERAARASSDAMLADEIDRDGVEAFVDRWERLPLWESQSVLPETVRQRLRDQRLRSDARGLANSLRGLGAGVTPPLHEHLHEILAPTLVLCGELDRKYVTLACEMASAIPRSTLTVAANAGHAVHLERPQEFIRAVNAFLEGVEERA